MRDAARQILRDATKGDSHQRGSSGGGRNRPQTRSSEGSSSAQVSVWSGSNLPTLKYAPHPDNVADPGEVVWAWVPFEEDPSQGKDRPVVVLALTGGRLLVSQLTSKDHDLDAQDEARWGRYWFDVGSGNWDSRHRPSEARLDRLLLVRPGHVRRIGGRLDRQTFDALAQELARFHN